MVVTLFPTTLVSAALQSISIKDTSVCLSVCLSVCMNVVCSVPAFYPALRRWLRAKLRPHNTTTGSHFCAATFTPFRGVYTVQHAAYSQLKRHNSHIYINE